MIADVAVVYREGGGFGSGRLIAPGLVLTAAHVVGAKDCAKVGAPWNVLLMRMFGSDGTWEAPYKANIVWTDPGGLDVALLQIASDGEVTPMPEPCVAPVFASYDGLVSLPDVRASGFPTAWRSEGKTRDFTVPGTLWQSSRDLYAWAAMSKPDKPEGWQGMSGSTLYLPTQDGRICLLGIVQQVPANFARGHLDAARISTPFSNNVFRALIESSLGRGVSIESVRGVNVESQRARIEPVSLLSRFPGLSDGVSGNAKASLEGFLAEYLLRPSAPLTFLGREAELDDLDRWLAGSSSSAYAALLGPAGRGKSALVTQWAARVSDRGNCDVALVPISMRFGLTSPDELGKLFLQRLRYLGHSGSELTGSPEAWLDEIQETLNRDRLPHERPLLVVIDGWDEARNPRWLRLPALLGNGVHVIVCSRSLAGESTAAESLDRIGLPHGSVCPKLPLLSEKDLAEGCANFEARLPGLARRLWQLSKGDPLLARLYLDRFSEALDCGEPIPEDDSDEGPGLARYMRIWWEQIDRGQSALKSEDVRRLLYTLAIACGPLNADDLAEIAQLEPLDVSAAREPLNRLIIGDGRSLGYVFSHPRIAQFVSDEQMTSAAKADMERRFLAYCRKIACALEVRNAAYSAPSRYVLTFCFDHFRRGGAPIADYRLLLSEGWMRARCVADGHYSAFLADLLRVRLAAEESGAADLLTRCALSKATVISMGTAVPAKLLRMALDEKVITGSQAVEEISASEGPYARAVSLSTIAGGLHQEDCARALEVAWQIEEPEARLIALAALSAVLPPAERDSLAQALDSAPPLDSAVGVLLQRAIDANLGRPVSPELPDQWVEALQGDFGGRIWNDIPGYIEWVRHITSALNGVDRDVFVREVVSSTEHRHYKWLEKHYAQQLIFAIGDVVPADALDSLDALLTESGERKSEGHRHLLARRLALQLVQFEPSILDGLNEAHPWASLPLLIYMDGEQRSIWAERCLARCENSSTQGRWHELSRCLPFVSTARRAAFVKKTWTSSRRIRDLPLILEFGAAAAAAMNGTHKAPTAERFLDRTQGMQFEDMNSVALLACEASPHVRRMVRLRISDQVDSENIDALLLLCPRLERGERERILGYVLEMERIEISTLPCLARCFDYLDMQERRDLASACLERLTGRSTAWSRNRNSNLLRAELIEKLAFPIISILGGNAVSQLEKVARRIENSENRSLAYASLTACTKGTQALEFAKKALLAFVDSRTDSSGLLRIHDLLPAASAILSLPVLPGLTKPVADKVARVLEELHKRDPAGARSRLRSVFSSGDMAAMQYQLDSAARDLGKDLQNCFAMLREMFPAGSTVTRKLWARGMDSAAERGRFVLLEYLTCSVPLIEFMLGQDEFKDVVDSVLDVTSWEWQ
ncbi:serine protease [Paraburkholderia fungorum]|uniref:S1 family peptidase n=1 Tax=Paraburkholderia fungorum TaxID=134537 RepID=UPI001C7D909D|nr:serine protease [Paraburkholderia fungorum]